MKERLKYFLAAIVSCAMWGCFSIPLRNLKNYSSTDILIYRIFVSLLICTLVSLLFRRKKIQQDILYLKALPKNQSRRILWLIGISSVFITANWFSFIFAINHISIQSGAFAYMVCPIITALLGFFILKEELNRYKWIAVSICVISISILAINFYRDILYSVLIALLYAIYLILQKKIEGINKFNILLVQLTISAILILPYYFMTYHPAPVDPSFWINIVVISVVFTIIPLFLSLYALIGIPSSTMGIIIYINPIISFCVAFLYFHEKATLLQFVAYMILLFAILLFNRNIILSFLPNKSTKSESL